MTTIVDFVDCVAAAASDMAMDDEHNDKELHDLANIRKLFCCAKTYKSFSCLIMLII